MFGVNELGELLCESGVKGGLRLSGCRGKRFVWDGRDNELMEYTG